MAATPDAIASPETIGENTAVGAADLEKQGLTRGAASRDDYGAAAPLSGKGDAAQGLPLLFGCYSISPEALLNAIVKVFVLVFAVNILADALYLCTVDARFPRGLGGYYPSESERLQSVSYTRQTLAVSMLHRSVMFAAAMACVLLNLFARVDVALRWFEERIGGLLARCSCMCAPCRWCASCSSQYCCCCCGPVRRYCEQLFERHSAKELLHGAFYLAIFSTCFFVIAIPFAYYSQLIDLQFGFANALTVNAMTFRRTAIAGLLQALVFSIPGSFLFLAVLQFRQGWICMWVGTVIVTIFVQYNFAKIAPAVVGATNVFPNAVFAVGRGFPLATTANKAQPLVSLNRIYFNTTDDSSKLLLETNDKSPGHLVLQVGQNSHLVITAKQPKKAVAPPKFFAHSAQPVPSGISAADLLERIGEQGWSQGDQSTRIGSRSGKALRAKVMGWAKERDISIAEIYLIDGSHKDARANAFVGGLGSSIIGLYDTLFLGAHARDAVDEDSGSISSHILVSADAGIQALSNFVQGVDISAENNEEVWSSAPTQAMTDDEIVAILAHELAHAALGHLHQGMLMSSLTSLATFAAVGWAAHSPVLAAALTLQAPLVHIGACVDSHVLGPPLDFFIGFFSDWLTRANEYEADAYVAKLSPKYGVALQTSLMKLTVNSNQDPDMPLWYEALRTDHPTAAHRWANIEAAKQEALKRQHLFLFFAGHGSRG